MPWRIIFQSTSRTTPLFVSFLYINPYLSFWLTCIQSDPGKKNMNIERWDVHFDRCIVGNIYSVPHIIEVFPVLKVYDMHILIFLDNVMLTHLPMYNPVCSMLPPHCHHQHQYQRARTILMSSAMSMRWWTILRKLYHLQLTPSSSLVILLLCIPLTTTEIYTPPPRYPPWKPSTNEFMAYRIKSWGNS